MDIKKFLQPKYLLIGGIAVVGGLFLAGKFRPKSGGSAEGETVVATPILQPYGVDSDVDAQRYDQAPVSSGGSSSGSVTIPAPKPKPVPVPTTPPEPRKQPLPGYPGPKPPTPPPRSTPVPRTPQPPEPPTTTTPVPGTPRRDKTPAPPGPPPITANIPGGYPADCRGVLPRPSDHPGADVLAFVHRSKNPSQTIGKMLAWSVGGQTTAITPSKLQAMNTAINNKGLWPLINAQRRSRGLKALSNDAFEAMRNRISIEARSRRDSFSEQFLLELWNTYHLPYLCA